MSPVVRVVPTGRRPGPALLPRRVRVGLGELVLAARLAGGVPLPVGGVVGTAGRVADRLAGADDTRAGLGGEAVAREVRRADDDGPSGARAALAGRGLLVADAIDPGVVAALHVLAGGPLSAVLDVSAVRRSGDVRLRQWSGATRGLVAQLAVTGPADVELAWFDPRLWVSQLARAATVEPWVRERAPLALPDVVSLPTELLVGSARAHREHRPDLLAAMAAAHAGAVRLGDAREVRAACDEEVLALVRTLHGSVRGRLRLLMARRDRPRRPAVAVWLLLDDGWHELRPGRAATSVLRRRHPRDLGLVTLPAVQSLGREAA